VLLTSHGERSQQAKAGPPTHALFSEELTGSSDWLHVVFPPQDGLQQSQNRVVVPAVPFVIGVTVGPPPELLEELDELEELDDLAALDELLAIPELEAFVLEVLLFAPLLPPPEVDGVRLEELVLPLGCDKVPLLVVVLVAPVEVGPGPLAPEAF
jgi:hypothetical protein